jgi:hypothetical protein
MLSMTLLFGAALAAGPAAPALLADTTETTVSGVTMPSRIDVEGHQLVLNGMALRKKAIFKVYVAGLYVVAKDTSAGQILASDAPRRMVMHFVRGVDAKKICEGWDDGLTNNTPEASEELKTRFKTLCGMMEDIEKEQEFVFTYLPGQGTKVEAKGNPKGTVEGKEFADALLRCWIGPKPGPGEGFKKKLLGLES